MSTRSGLGDKRNRHDPAYLRAKKESFAGRAVYKLQEIDQKYRLIKPGMAILDLGCWPGSWLQYSVQRAGTEAILVGVDLEQVELALPANVQTFVGDVNKLKLERLVERFGRFDLVLSDMAPNTTGNKDYDIPTSEDLFLRALDIATATSRIGGHFCAKVFQGGRFHELLHEVEARFQMANAYRPANTRRASREQYIIGRGLKATVAREHSVNVATAPSDSSTEFVDE